MYEQYYGDEVALFGKDNLQKDPRAVTVGVDYPFPLATLKVSHKMGKDGKSNTELGLQVSYQIGTPLEKQLDPGNVAAMRSLKAAGITWWTVTTTSYWSTKRKPRWRWTWRRCQ